jgi:hypothetical protein
LKTIVDLEGWKVSYFRGMYAAKLSTFIQVIWLKGNQLTYVVKTLMNFIVLAKGELVFYSFQQPL